MGKDKRTGRPPKPAGERLRGGPQIRVNVTPEQFAEYKAAGVTEAAVARRIFELAAVLGPHETIRRLEE